MFPYTEKYTEFESDIKNNNLFYEIGQQCQNTFDCSIFFGKCSKTIKNSVFLFCTMYKFHNSYFVIFVNFVLFMFYIYVQNKWINTYIYIYYFDFDELVPRHSTRTGLEWSLIHAAKMPHSRRLGSVGLALNCTSLHAWLDSFHKSEFGAAAGEKERQDAARAVTPRPQRCLKPGLVTIAVAPPWRCGWHILELIICSYVFVYASFFFCWRCRRGKGTPRHHMRRDASTAAMPQPRARGHRRGAPVTMRLAHVWMLCTFHS